MASLLFEENTADVFIIEMANPTIISLKSRYYSRKQP